MKGVGKVSKRHDKDIRKAGTSIGNSIANLIGNTIGNSMGNSIGNSIRNSIANFISVDSIQKTITSSIIGSQKMYPRKSESLNMLVPWLFWQSLGHRGVLGSKTRASRDPKSLPKASKRRPKGVEKVSKRHEKDIRKAGTSIGNSIANPIGNTIGNSIGNAMGNSIRNSTGNFISVDSIIADRWHAPGGENGTGAVRVQVRAPGNQRWFRKTALAPAALFRTGSQTPKNRHKLIR